MTKSVYSPSPVFANLPLKLAAARAAEKLYLEDGKSMFVDYIAKETARASSMLLLPAQVASTRKAANARAHHNFRRAYVEMFSYGREIASGPVLHQPAVRPAAVDTFVRELVDNLEAQLEYELWQEAHGHLRNRLNVTDDERWLQIRGQLAQDKALKAWGNTQDALSRYMAEHHMVRVTKDEWRELTDDEKAERASQRRWLATHQTLAEYERDMEAARKMEESNRFMAWVMTAGRKSASSDSVA